MPANPLLQPPASSSKATRSPLTNRSKPICRQKPSHPLLGT
jgi:hypothetical protein